MRRFCAQSSLPLFSLVLILGAVLDQLTKFWARAVLVHTQTLVPGFLSLSLVENSGAAFSLGEGASAVFVVFALVIIFGIALYLKSQHNLSRGFVLALSFVAAGGLGNLIDRLYKASVTDFIRLDFISFPIFNLADIFVSLGIIVVLFYLFAYKGDLSFKASQPSADASQESSHKKSRHLN